MHKTFKFLLLIIAWIFIMSIVLPAHAGGTGFFITNDGYILTNHHVATQMHKDDIPVPLLVNYNGKLYQAHLIYINHTEDLALYKIDATNTPCMPVAQEDVQYGQVLHIGTFDFRNGYAQRLKIVFNLKIVDILDNIDGIDSLGNRSSYDLYPPYIRPGDSGSPAVDDNGNIVSVVWGSETLPGNIHIMSYSLINSTLTSFVRESGVSGCQRPIKEVRDDIVWFES